MLDLLPTEVWPNPTTGGSTRFASRECSFARSQHASVEGLAAWQPDFEKRREHIYRNMLFGVGSPR